MKKLILLLSIFLVGCNETPTDRVIKYDLVPTWMYTIPEENKIKYSEFVSKSLSSATIYEDADDFVKEVENVANKLYGKPVYGLHEVDKDNWLYETNRSKMTEKERQIYDSLLRYVQ